jgi:hypothetical protein
MTAIVSRDRADDRADALAAANLNGLRLVLVALPPGPAPDHAVLDLRFWNDRHVAAILAEITADPARAGRIFRVRGGTRLPAGNLPGQVRVVAVSAGGDATRLELRVEPVGDYSTYTLELVWDGGRIDPFFAEIGFKFRPGCFTNDCAPQLPGRPALPGPVIDYLAKDYDSFRHVLMTAMAARVPGWKSTSEADHDQVLIDLFAAAADELSDFQDRVMGEAYLATTRKRVSLARHARLMDYHLHEGNQASTWLALELTPGFAPFTLDAQTLVAWTGAEQPLAESVFFASREHRLPAAQRQRLDPLVNALRLHTWREAQPALRAGSTGADVVPVPAGGGGGGQAEADALRDLVRSGGLRQLLIAERLNPLTGLPNGRNPRKRQLLRLRAGAVGPFAAQTVFDPLTNVFLVRLHWDPRDALRQDYSFTSFCNGVPTADISMFHGNLVPVYEGRPMAAVFHEPGADLPADTAEVKQRHFTRLDRYGTGFDWALAALPEGPLAYLPTPVGGEVPARSTLHVEVTVPAGGTDAWDEVESLVHSDASAEQGDHFMVETDERRRSLLRFGNGSNGQRLPHGATVQAQYQIGGGAAGNIGADQLVFARALTGPLSGAIRRVWNPFDVTDGRDAEPAEKIRRNAPEAYRARQLRAVTLADYVRRAEEVNGVARAVARYAWTGSWRTVRVTIDPEGTTTLDEPLRAAVAAHLEAVRLIGEDIELRPPRFVPLDIRIVVCALAEVWREDLRFVLEQEFSDDWTSDGRRGFFHPDEWSFGQALHRSRIEGRLHQVAGIEHVVSIVMKRFDAPTPGVPDAEVLEMGFDEVLLLANDPDHLQRGLIRFDIRGGRG